MSASLANCRKCKKLYQKRLADICQECTREEEERFVLLYRTLQESAAQGGMEIKTLSDKVDVPVEDIERFYLEGRLSTAGIYLKFPCQTCGAMTSSSNRKGRFCNPCSDTNATKAGVEVRSIQEIFREDEKRRLQEEYQSLLKQSGRAARQFGRNHGLGKP